MYVLTGRRMNGRMLFGGYVMIKLVRVVGEELNKQLGTPVRMPSFVELLITELMMMVWRGMRGKK